MSTALSSTEAHGSRLPEALRPVEVRRAATDARSLFAFRTATLRGRSRRIATVALVVIGLITLGFAVAPAYLPEASRLTRFDALILLPSAFVAVLVFAVVSLAASGGGRELVPREEGVAFPISPTADHFGALLMAPLNLAFLLQSWTMLGLVAYATPPSWRLLPIQLVTLLWMVLATAIAQAVAWGIEWVRRGPRGVWTVRGIGVVILLAGAVVVAGGWVGSVLDRNRPVLWVVEAILDVRSGHWLDWVFRVVVVAVVIGLTVVAGALGAAAVSHRQARDELKQETASRRPSANPGSDLGALLHADRASVWRSVPLRRGLFVLGFMPGAVALAGGLRWETLEIFPGLVASGGALLFGVNAWCLDGRGALWRDSLPVRPEVVFAARAIVLAEVLAVATAITMLLAMLRAGLPSVSQLVALLCSVVVVIAWVVSRSMRWSVTRPYAVDMRSARATPAPPLVMVGYSTRLALTTTLFGMLFAGTAYLGASFSVVLALPIALFAAYQAAGTAQTWADPDARARVVSTVVG